MVIGFLGKGGSGKSTLASRAARLLADRGDAVLAVDADHNMDLAYNLSPEMPERYVGQGLQDALAAAGLPEGADYRQAFLDNYQPAFRLAPPDDFTARYSRDLGGNLRLMVCGPHDERVLYGQGCSHVLGTPLKVYFPFLSLGAREWAIVDEKAGADGVGTGVTTGFDAAVVVAEPTPHGLKAAVQISGLLDFYGTPHVFALNKIRGAEDVATALAALPRPPAAIFPFHPDAAAPSAPLPAGYADQLSSLVAACQAAAAAAPGRMARSREKFLRNKDFKTRQGS
jgi:CO dehydrogenase maturation factor